MNVYEDHGEVDAGEPDANGGDPEASKEMAAIIALPDVQEKLRNLGVEPDGRTTDGFAAFQRAEISKWSQVIKDAGIQPE